MALKGIKENGFRSALKSEMNLWKSDLKLIMENPMSFLGPLI